jgi:hypothetical protein
MLAIYRELKLNQADMLALEEHLSQCTACKEVQAQYDFAGQGLRALPCIEPLPDAHTKLMKALATEHIRFIQNASPSIAATPTPPFLAPYLKDLAQTPHANNLAAFATAETGPIPIVQPLTKRRPIYQINHFTIIGVAASFLMMLLVGSLTSLVLLNQQGNRITPPSLVVHQLNDVRAVNYTTTAVYPHVASAIASGHNIYYTTYNDDQTSWQLEQFDEKANVTTPLLAKPSTQELLVLGSSADWLVWQQIDPPKSADASSQASNNTNTPPTRTWSLHAQYLGSTQSPTTQTTDRELISKTFNPTAVPSWVNRPIQGICFFQDTLLVAFIDADGISHLQSYKLDPVKEITQTELANASHGHLLASPTANSDGTAIYWAEEYSSNASGQLSSDIWTQQTLDASPTNAGRWAAHQITKKYAFRTDGKSFHPQIVSGNLFLLSASQTNGNTSSTSPIATVTPPIQSATTPQAGSPATGELTATPTATNLATLPASTTNLDSRILAPQIDAMQTGRILTFTVRGVPQVLPQFDNTQIVTAFQAGAGFLLWQELGSTFGMYDVIAKAPVQVGDNVVPPNAAFLAVNGDTAVSVIGQLSNQDQHNQVKGPIMFDTFRWPIPRS